MFRTVTAIVLFVTFCVFSGSAKALVLVHTLESPNKEFKVDILSGPIDQTSAHVYFRGQKILELHNLGFELANGEFVPTPLLSKEFVGRIRTTEDRTNALWQGVNVRGPHPNREVRNPGEVPYNETFVEYEGVLKIVFRASDHYGIQFRYEFEPKDDKPIEIKRELTEFVFDGDRPCYTRFTLTSHAIYSLAGSGLPIPMSESEASVLWHIGIANGPLVELKKLQEAKQQDGSTMLVGRTPPITFPGRSFSPPSFFKPSELYKPGEKPGTLIVPFDPDAVVPITDTPWHTIRLGRPATALR